MLFFRPTAIIAAFLIIAVSIPQSFYSQKAPKPSQPKQSAPRQRQPKRGQRGDALAAAINELMKLDPLAPESLDKKRSDNADASSEEESKPPADDAPIKELIAYWTQDHDTNAPKPSDKVRQRLLEVCETRPELTPNLVDFLPETTDTHDRLYKLLEEEPGDEFQWKSFLRDWLQHNSRYFRDELIAAARAADDRAHDAGEDLKALARLDWDAARPILESLASAGKFFVTPVALALLYEHAMQNGDSAQAESHRALLKAIVTNRQASWSARAEVLMSLMKTEWGGQEEWLVSLFADPTLSNIPEDEIESAVESKDESSAKTDAAKGAIAIEDVPVARDVGFSGEFKPGILASVFHRNIDKWLPVVSDLAGHSHRTVRQAAVKCLASFLNYKSCDEKRKKEIAQRLAPCLTEPGWAAAEDRLSLIESLVNLQAPELLSGLIWVLEHDEDQDNRAAAAEAVTQYRDPRVIPALRHALEREENENRREKIVTALAECGGFSDDEMAAAIEAYAKTVVSEGGEQEIGIAEAGDSDKSLPLKVSIGRILRKSETIQATEGMAIRLFERAKALRTSQPAVAREILRSIEGAPLRVAKINLVERIGAGWADIDALTLALENRDSVQKSAGDELYGLIKQGGYAAGIAATILNDEREQRETLGGTDAKAQLALLAGARYLREKLPVELASKLLDSPNRALAKAAESYLEVEDSAAARKLVMARHPGEAYILGDIFTIGDRRLSFKIPPSWEEAMRKEIKSDPGLEAIYALGRTDSERFSNGVIIRVRDGKAEISLYEVEGRRNVRLLTESEFEELRSFTSRQEVEDLGPESHDDDAGRRDYEYLRLTKEGGRRIALDGLHRAPKNPTLHEELSGLFYRLSRSGEFITRYAIEDKIPGVEVLLADKNQEAMMICGEGREIRVLIGEKGAPLRRLAEAMPEGREFSSGKPGKLTDDPTACRVLSMISLLMKNKWNDNFGDLSLPARSGDAWVYSLLGKDAGIWKFEPGAEPAKIISGSYVSPFVTPDGKWLVAIKTMNEGGEYSPRLVRHNLQTGKEFPVIMPNAGYHPPCVFVAAHGKVLLGGSGSLGQAGPGAINYLLDPETGKVQQVKGEFRPLIERFPRELQPTGNPNEFWAAVADEQKRATSLGRYDSRNFVFRPLVELPGLKLSNSDFWVDVTGSKIWFTDHGHLLRIPLPAMTK